MNQWNKDAGGGTAEGERATERPLGPPPTIPSPLAVVTAKEAVVTAKEAVVTAKEAIVIANL